MKPILLLLILTITFTNTFSQNLVPQKDILEKKLLIIEERNFLKITTYRFYNPDHTNRLNSFELAKTYRKNNTWGASQLIRTSLLAKVGGVLLASTYFFIPQTKKVPAYVGGSNGVGYYGTTTVPSAGSYIAPILSIGGGLLYDVED
jgi:hypothetical protein